MTGACVLNFVDARLRLSTAIVSGEIETHFDVMGMFEDESTGAGKRRRIDILKGRDGQTGEFFVNLDWTGMNFHEWGTEPANAWS